VFLAITAAASVLAGAIASVSGFGIGSLLTPLFDVPYDMRLAVAAVSIPHGGPRCASGSCGATWTGAC
jgi:uncharacterized membrane protein YfcA